MSNDDDGLMDLLLNAWWGRLLVGLIMTGLGFWQNYNFEQYEDGAGDLYLPSFTHGIYESAGKWPFLAVFFGIGGLLVLWGIWRLVKDRLGWD